MNQELDYQKGVVSIQGKEIPVWCFVASPGFNRVDLSDSIEDVLGGHFIRSLIHSCRGVTLDRLPVILETGCDLEPSNAPFFAGPLEKALEYGHDGDQLIQVFDSRSVQPSFRERCAATLTDEERAEIEKDYPTVIHSDDGSMIWFTRLAYEDNRAASGYEREYGYWIPGNPAEALSVIILISSDPKRFAECLPPDTLTSDKD